MILFLPRGGVGAGGAVRETNNCTKKMPLLQLMSISGALLALAASVSSADASSSYINSNNGRGSRRRDRRMQDYYAPAMMDMARQSIKFQRCYELNVAAEATVEAEATAAEAYAEAEATLAAVEEAFGELFGDEPEENSEVTLVRPLVEEEEVEGFGPDALAAAEELWGDFLGDEPEEHSEVTLVRPIVVVDEGLVWFDRTSGWEGQTYDEAVTFCSNVPISELCSYDAICPDGEGEPFGGHRYEEDSSSGPLTSWAPANNRPNMWVKVSSDGNNSCSVSEGIYGEEGNEELTRHVACCQILSEAQANEDVGQEDWEEIFWGGLTDNDDHGEEEGQEETEAAVVVLDAVPIIDVNVGNGDQMQQAEAVVVLDEVPIIDAEAGNGDQTQQQAGGLRKRTRRRQTASPSEQRRGRRLEEEESLSNSFVAFRTCYDSTCGESCDREYGEYTMDMETYLEITLSYLLQGEQEDEEDPCRLCEECHSLFWSEGVEGEKYLGECQGVDIATCKNDCIRDGNGVIDASELVECQIIHEDEDPNAVLYAGPACTSGGSKIEIAVFTDEFCTNREVTKRIEDYLVDDDGNRMTLSYNLLMRAQNQDGCVASCLAENNIETNNKQNQNYYSNNANGNQGAASAQGPEINEICEDLRQFSSKINVQDDLENEYYYYDDDAQEEYMPDLAKYSLKFESCNEDYFEEEEVITDVETGGLFDDGTIREGVQSTVSFTFCPSDSTAVDCDEPCNTGFQTMVVDMQLYLDVMVGFRKDAQDQYCEDCLECTNMLEEGGNGANSFGACANIDTTECNSECELIKNMKQNGYADASDYRQCQMIHRADNEVYFAGPKCASGGRQIEIGIFLDADCTIPDATKTVESYLFSEDGSEMKLSYSVLDTVTATAGLSSNPPNCHVTQCLHEDARFNQNQNGEESAWDFGYRINEVCEVLYQESMHTEHDDHDDRDEYYNVDEEIEIVVEPLDHTQRDYNALALFYRMTRGQNWDVNDMWLSDDENVCEWYGVGCNEHGAVTKLELSNNSIQGPLGNSVSQLANLTTLDLSNNKISGVLGEDMRNLQRLAQLKLGKNYMRGSIPSSLSRLPHLESLELQENQFSYFPMTLFSYASLENLTTVNIASNMFMGTMPHDAFAEQPKLQYLNVSQNNFVGTIGAGIMRASVEHQGPIVLDLSFNHFEGAVPDFENDMLTINVVGNRLDAIDQTACGRLWNEGSTEKYGCDGIACPIGTSNSEGRQTDDNPLCEPCEVAKFVGNVGCEEVEDYNIYVQGGDDTEVIKPPTLPPIAHFRRVNYDLWISPVDAASIDFLRSFQDTARKLQEHAYFAPRLYLFDGTQTDCIESDEDDSCKGLCTNGGRICAADPNDEFDSDISGAAIVRESYRWLLIFEYSRRIGAETQWWDYVLHFTDNCVDGLFANEQCAIMAMERSGIDPDIITELMENYGGLVDERNKLLEEAIYLKQEHNITTLPTLVVDRIPTRGELNPTNALGAICTRFMPGAARPDVCPPNPTINDNLSVPARPEGEDAHIYLESEESTNQSLAGASMSNITTSSNNSTANYTTYNATTPSDITEEPSSVPSSQPSSAPSTTAPTSAPTDFIDGLAPNSAGQCIILFWQASLLVLTPVLFLWGVLTNYSI